MRTGSPYGYNADVLQLLRDGHFLTTRHHVRSERSCPSIANRVAAGALAAAWHAGVSRSRRGAPRQRAAPRRRSAAASAPRRQRCRRRRRGGQRAVPASLDSRIQDVKSDVIKLNRDLLVLEEELLFPANTQVALFVSMDVGKMFELDSVQIKLDDKVVTNYLYTPIEVQALHRGGVQRVYLGNLKAGEHEIVAFFTGKGPHDRDYKRGATIKFDKGTDPKYIELRIKDSTGKLQPEFDVKVWQ